MSAEDIKIEEAVSVINRTEEESARAVEEAARRARAVAADARTAARAEISQYAKTLEDSYAVLSAEFEKDASHRGDIEARELIAAAKAPLESAAARVTAALEVLEKKFRKLEWI